jgi:hypothetical protein
MKFTHKGIIVGSDARTPDGYSKNVMLRQTKNFWVSQSGTKYHKHYFAGSGVGDWPLTRLKIDSITPLYEQPTRPL